MRCERLREVSEDVIASNQTMRVVQVLESFTSKVGGVRRVVDELSKALAYLGPEVTILTFGSDEQVKNRGQSRRLKVLSLEEEARSGTFHYFHYFIILIICFRKLLRNLNLTCSGYPARNQLNHYPHKQSAYDNWILILICC